MRQKSIGAFAILAIVACVGCATFQSNAGKTLATIAASVDSAMKGWATYVVVSNTVTPEQEAKVRGAYIRYQAAMATAQSAWNALGATNDKDGWTKALEALTAAQANLAQLIAAFSQGGVK